MKKRDSKERLERLLVEFTESLGEDPGRAEEILSSSAETEAALSLLNTVRLISSVIQPKQPSEEFSARLSQAVQERFQQRTFEEFGDKIRRIVDMAASDDDFRRNFFRDRIAACRSIGLDLTPQEMAALREIKEDTVEEFSNNLDERISKFFPGVLP